MTTPRLVDTGVVGWCDPATGVCAVPEPDPQPAQAVPGDASIRPRVRSAVPAAQTPVETMANAVTSTPQPAMIYHAGRAAAASPSAIVPDNPANATVPNTATPSEVPT